METLFTGKYKVLAQRQFTYDVVLPSRIGTVKEDLDASREANHQPVGHKSPSRGTRKNLGRNYSSALKF